MFKALKRQQAQLEVQARRNRLATFTEPIKVEGDEESADLKEFLCTFYQSIYNKRRGEIQLILQSLPTLDKHYRTLVPSRFTYEDFWQRYFYRCDVDRVLRQWARKEKLAKNEPSGGGLTAGRRGFKQFIGAATDTTAAAKSTLVQEEVQPKILVTVQGEVQPKKLQVAVQEEVQSKKLDFTEAPKNEVKPRPVQTASTGRAAAKKAQSAVAAEIKETEPTLSEGFTEAPKNKAKPPVQTASTGRAAAKKAQSAVAAETKETESTLSEESSVATPQTIQVMAAALVVLLAVVVSVVLLLTSSPSLGNNMCAPVLPYRTLGNEPTSLEAPWWAPSSVKAQAFDITCGSRFRTRLDWTFIGKNDNGLYQLTVVNIANDARPLMKRRRATSLQIRSSYMLLSNHKGEQEQIAAPWIMA
jgi:hypothetical protein